MQTYTLSRGNVLSRIYLGLFASLGMAAIGLYVGQFVPPGLLMILSLVELVAIIVAMFAQRSRSIGMTFVLGFTFVSGMTLFPVIAMYTSMLGATTVLEAVGVSAGAFLVAAMVASKTTNDFRFLGGFLFIGLIALMLMGLISLFVGFSSTFQLGYSMLGIAIFIGYVLFDINRIARNGVAAEQVPWVVLSLYLDFINLLLFVLRLLGVLQSNRR